MKKHILFGSIIALLFLSACGTFNRGESGEVEAEAVEENLNIGETSTIAGISLTVDDAYYADKINRSANTNPDAILIVDLTVENNSGKDYSLGVDIDLYVDGVKTNTYPVEKLMSRVADGETASGQRAFEIKGEPSEFELEFSPSKRLKSEKVRYTIEPE